jgi:hypothetical protein
VYDAAKTFYISLASQDIMGVEENNMNELYDSIIQYSRRSLAPLALTALIGLEGIVCSGETVKTEKTQSEKEIVLYDSGNDKWKAIVGISLFILVMYGASKIAGKPNKFDDEGIDF